MSIKTMDKVLSRLFLDESFRAQLRRNPEQALDGYDLTQRERMAFMKFSKRSRQTRSKKQAN